MRAVLEGELVCLGDDGRSLFHRLLYRRDWPSFFAFDLLEVDVEDLRDQRLVARVTGGCGRFCRA
jgi:ATP-dependent DNA ligase